MPGHVTGGPEPYRPTVAAWIEAPEGHVVGFDVATPEDEHGALGRALSKAMQQPLVGPPRRPSKVRVADASLAAEVRAVVGDLIPVTIAATPELEDVADAVFDSMLNRMGPASDRKPVEDDASYLEEGRISPEVVANLFSAARVLGHVAPWKVADDQQVLRLDIPELGVDGACVSIIGALGDHLGFLIFPSHAGFRSFLEVASNRSRRSRRMDLGTTWLSLTLVPRAELPASMRREIATHGWSEKGDKSNPLVEHRERDAFPRPLTERDVRIVSMCATSLSAFFITNRGAFEAADPEPICQSFSDDSDRIVRFTLPYEAFPLFDVGTDTRPASVDSGPIAAGRNDPCPCGSGKKYKKCHLRKGRVGQRPPSTPSP